MFSDKQKQSWKNVKAPDGLLEKIESASCEASQKHKYLKRIMLPIIAASFIFVFSAMFIMAQTGTVDVYLDDVLLTEDGIQIEMSAAPMMVSRSVTPTSSLTLTLDVESDTAISTTYGEFSVVTESGDVIFTGNEYTLVEKSIIIWTYPLEDECQLWLVNGLNEDVIIVERDELSSQQTVRRLKN